MGHTVKVISPQFVKPFVKGQKNDGNDAEAIAIALQQPTMRFVPPRSIEQHVIQALHRARQRLDNHRSANAARAWGTLFSRVSKKKTDRFSTWVNSVHERRDHTQAIVAVANKNAPIIWVLLRYETAYNRQSTTSH